MGNLLFASPKAKLSNLGQQPNDVLAHMLMFLDIRTVEGKVRLLNKRFLSLVDSKSATKMRTCLSFHHYNTYIPSNAMNYRYVTDKLLTKYNRVTHLDTCNYHPMYTIDMYSDISYFNPFPAERKCNKCIKITTDDLYDSFMKGLYKEKDNYMVDRYMDELSISKSDPNYTYYRYLIKILQNTIYYLVDYAFFYFKQYKE